MKTTGNDEVVWKYIKTGNKIIAGVFAALVIIGLILSAMC